MRKIRPHITYANVISTLCLFLLITGGSALAAVTLGKNSVGSPQLKAKSVTSGKIAPGAVNGSRVANGSLTSEDIDLSKLGTVPSAVAAGQAGNANTVDGHDASCPEGTTLIRGFCFDSHSNPAAHGVEKAAENCAAKGGFLPTPMQLYVTRGILNLGSDVGANQHQFTDSLYGAPGSGHLDKTVVLDGVGPPEEFDATGESAYYCAYSLLR